MIPGEILPADGSITLNEGLKAVTLTVSNTGDRPVQVGSHYHHPHPSSSFFSKADTWSF